MSSQEAVVVCLDNSEFARNGDFTPTRLESQIDALNLIANTKTQANPENCIAALAYGGQSPEVLVSLSQDLGKIITCTGHLSYKETADIVSGIQVAQLALKHRVNKHQAQRIIVFCCSPVDYSEQILVKLAKKLKKNSISVDIINFGNEGENEQKLNAFVEAVNSNENSHFVNVTESGGILSDRLLATPIISSGFSAGVAAESTGGGGGDFEFGVDPSIDPELAMALRLSMEEENARQASLRQAPPAATATATATDSATSAAPQAMDTETDADGDTGEVMEVDDEELAAAIALSMEQTAPSDAVETNGEVEMATAGEDLGLDDDDEELRLAIELSMAESREAEAASSRTAETPLPAQAAQDQITPAPSKSSVPAAPIKPSSSSENGAKEPQSPKSQDHQPLTIPNQPPAMTPSFVSSIILDLPGVNPEDERIKRLLETTFGEPSPQKKKKEQKQEDEKEDK